MRIYHHIEAETKWEFIHRNVRILIQISLPFCSQGFGYQCHIIGSGNGSSPIGRLAIT